jgi:hypothetical protein
VQAAGVPIKVISEILGHTTSAFTADAYTEVAKELHESAAAAGSCSHAGWLMPCLAIFGQPTPCMGSVRTPSRCLGEQLPGGFVQRGRPPEELRLVYAPALQCSLNPAKLMMLA